MKFLSQLTLLLVLPLIITLSSCKKNDNHPIDKSLVLNLTLDGNSNDQSIYKTAGIIDSALISTDRNSKPGSAGLFDSTGTYIRIPNSDLLDTISKFSLCAWIKPISFNGVGNNTIINKGYAPWGNPYYQYHLGITGNKHLTYPGSFTVAVSIDNQYTILVSDPHTWTPGNWYHVVGTYDGDSLKLFVNGEQKKAMYLKGAVGHFQRDVFIGKTAEAISKSTGLPAVTNTPGTIDEIRIYNRALKEQEIKSLFNQ